MTDYWTSGHSRTARLIDNNRAIINTMNDTFVYSPQDHKQRLSLFSSTKSHKQMYGRRMTRAAIGRSVSSILERDLAKHNSMLSSANIWLDCISEAKGVLLLYKCDRTLVNCVEKKLLSYNSVHTKHRS